MDKQLYTADQIQDAVTMFDIIKNIPKGRRFLASALAEAFMRGLEMKEKLDESQQFNQDPKTNVDR